jgi:hypothetical protein
MNKEAKVHMLPTKDKSILYKRNDTNELHLGDFNYCESDDKLRTNQHLYVTTDEEIKEGDWFLDGTMVPKNNLDDLEYELFGKIIATTDPELHYNKVVEEDMHMYKESLPHIPQHIIEAYVKKPFDKVMVEYECLTSTNTIVLDFSKVTADEAIKSDRKCIESRVKTDPNNCIIIHPVEERRKECMHDFHSVYYGSEWEVECKKCEENIFDLYEREDAVKWIKENL